MLHVTFVAVHITFYNVAWFILQREQVMALRRQSSMRHRCEQLQFDFQGIIIELRQFLTEAALQLSSVFV